MAKRTTPTSKTGISNSQTRGFTFIELAVVLLLIGILLVVTVPRFGDVIQGGSRTAARRMHGVIATAHDRAALQKRRFWLGMEVGAGRYWAVVTGLGENPPPEEIIRRKGKPAFDGSLPKGVVFKDVILDGKKCGKGAALAVFEPNGTCMDVQVHLVDDRGGICTLIVDPFTGRCKVDDSYTLRQAAQPGEGEEGQADENAAEGQDGGDEPVPEQEVSDNEEAQ